MLGLDKKAVDKLKKMRDLDGLSGPHRDIITSMLERYLDPDWHFFTSAQRRLIGDLHATYAEPPSAKDRDLLRQMDDAMDDPNLSQYENNRMLEILSRHGRVPKQFPPWDLKFVKDLMRDIGGRNKQLQVRIKLEKALNDGMVREGSEEFCRSIIQQFDERRKWSPVQMEHAEKILAGNADPGDSEIME